MVNLPICLAVPLVASATSPPAFSGRNEHPGIPVLACSSRAPLNAARLGAGATSSTSFVFRIVASQFPALRRGRQKSMPIVPIPANATTDGSGIGSKAQVGTVDALRTAWLVDTI